MKKLVSIVMVMAMILAMGIPVFAADDGSITITNATVGKEYSVHKIFDATIKKGTGTEPDAVAYSINPTENPTLFATLFGTPDVGGYLYFTYNSETHEVRKKDGVNDTDLINYLTTVVATCSCGATPVTATSETVTFNGLKYGYYVVKSTLGAVVTLDSVTPDVNVIDKNQEPGGGFDKQIQTGVDGLGNPIWGDSNSAGIGDQVTYKVSFEATNYDGDKKIKYYQINDHKGDAIWIEFNSFTIKVNGVELKKGYYLPAGGIDTYGLEFLGEWTDAEKVAPNARDLADWYLVHLGFDEFRITIPWMEDHSVIQNPGDPPTYNLEFPADAESKFASPVKVEATYTGVIEANANIGGVTGSSNLYNTASATWTSESESNSTGDESVETYVYGLGLLKDDSSTHQNLAGAEFRLYKDEACTDPVYVIPTNIDGVYILDSKGTPGAAVSGSYTDTSRKLYAAYLEDYLGADFENKQDNKVVTQVNGKLVVLGLAKGTYYLKETKAPDGYNVLEKPVQLEVGEGTKTFNVFANDAGEVADIQTTDGVYKENPYHLTTTTVGNSKGIELPSTGGQGTVWFITIGSMLAIAFAVFLITHKKMSVYED